ncbi:MAG TPA: hypothetical protein VFN21_04210 [Acidimicrobiales bacterium]|nr:hypothetical protein [Acidimicrobiales bacterium]
MDNESPKASTNAELDRRAMLRRIGAGTAAAGAAWVTPSVLSGSVAFAAGSTVEDPGPGLGSSSASTATTTTNPPLSSSTSTVTTTTNPPMDSSMATIPTTTNPPATSSMGTIP